MTATNGTGRAKALMAIAAIAAVLIGTAVSSRLRAQSSTAVADSSRHYLPQYTADGDAPRITLGIGVLCLYVLAFNRLLWRRLYNLAAERLRMD